METFSQYSQQFAKPALYGAPLIENDTFHLGSLTKAVITDMRKPESASKFIGTHDLGKTLIIEQRWMSSTLCASLECNGARSSSLYSSCRSYGSQRLMPKAQMTGIGGQERDELNMSQLWLSIYDQGACLCRPLSSLVFYARPPSASA